MTGSLGFYIVWGGGKKKLEAYSECHAIPQLALAGFYHIGRLRLANPTD